MLIADSSTDRSDADLTIALHKNSVLPMFTAILRASSLLSNLAAGQRLWGRFLIVDRCVWALDFGRILWDLILEGAGYGEGRGKTDAT
jgi:hypothetical protein